ncbi:hypothetical protein QLR68_03060, partial [Micromonospora sp. DH15]|nr:hypothetical protein [Micromonospora sp. DH15]
VRERTRLIPEERTANALDAVAGGLIDGLTDRRRAQVLRLARGSGAETEAAVAALLDAVPRREPPPPRFWQPWLARVRRVAVGLTDQRWVVRFVVLYLVVEPALTVVGVAVDGVTGALDEEREWGAVLGVSASALATAVLSIAAAVRLRRDRIGAFRLFKLAILVDLLFGQIFNFTVNQFGAVAALAFDLFLLAVVTAEHRRLSRAR